MHSKIKGRKGLGGSQLNDIVITDVANRLRRNVP